MIVTTLYINFHNTIFIGKDVIYAEAQVIHNLQGQNIGHRGRDCMCNRCLSPLKLWVQTPLLQGVFDSTLREKVCQWLVTGRWFSQGTSVSSTNKADFHDITEILLNVALNTINQTINQDKILSYNTYLLLRRQNAYSDLHRNCNNQMIHTCYHSNHLYIDIHL